MTWRLAQPDEDEAIVELCLALYRDDPGEFSPGSPITDRNIRTTLGALRETPARGRAVVLDIEGKLEGYALLIAFWSNELGGEICEIDELFVTPSHRSRGHGGALFEAIERGALWPAPVRAMVLLTTPDNARARRLYSRLGFTVVGTAMARRLLV